MKLPLPKQHGAWAMVIGPALLGLLTGRPGLGAAAALLLAFLSAFCAQHVAIRLLTQKRRVEGLARWLWIYLGLTAVLGGGLVLQGDHYSLLIYGFLAALYFAGHVAMMKRPGRREHRSLGFEILTVAILCLGALAGAEVAGGGLSRSAVWAYVGSFVFFAGSVFHVRAVVRRTRLKVPRDAAISRRSLAWETVVWHGAVGLGLFALAAVRFDGAVWYFVAFALTVVRAFWAVARLSEPKWNIRQIGVIEIFCTVAWIVGSAMLVR